MHVVVVVVVVVVLVAVVVVAVFRAVVCGILVVACVVVRRPVRVVIFIRALACVFGAVVVGGVFSFVLRVYVWCLVASGAPLEVQHLLPPVFVRLVCRLR